MLTLPEPDLLGAFHARIERLLDALTIALSADQDLLLVIPQPSDPADQAQWVGRMETEREGRPHLTSFWQAMNPTGGAPAPPWTIGMAFNIARDGLDGMTEDLAAEVAFCVENFVERKLRAAVLARSEIIQLWPRPRRETGAAAFALQALTTAVHELPKDEHPPSHHLVGYAEDEKPLVFYYWPGKAAPAVVAEWARKSLNTMGRGDAMVEEARRGMPSDIFLPHEGKLYRIPVAGLALLYLAELDVREGSRKPAIAIDASKVHHDLVGGMRDWPKDGRRHRGRELVNAPVRSEDVIERVELLAPGGTVQLHLPMPELEGMQDHAIEALRRLRGAKGLRHWAALLRLFSVEGGRSGTYRWLLSEHLTAMGYDERQRRDPKVRAEAAREVEALAALELAIYTQGGVLRERRRLLLETGRFERLVGAEYKLDGIEFQMNQRVFGGVRASTGEIGAKWMPAPVALATIDHARFPYAHALGMLLAIRVRWRLDEHADHLSLSGERLLQLAGIHFQKERAERGWGKLRRSLDVLVKVEQLDRYEWTSDAWSLAGICRIYPSPWLLDRAARGVLPEERPPDRDRPVTGGELKTWREKHSLSQRAAGKRLNVTQQAIAWAEGHPDAPLGHKLRTAFEGATSRPVDLGAWATSRPVDLGASDK